MRFPRKIPWWNRFFLLSGWSAMLSVRGLTVEVGGTFVVEGAGFTVRAGDSVGLVGRNGAGKTSLLRVLGGMAEPRTGVIQRPPRFGYLPQDPRLDELAPGVTAVTHVLGGRGLDVLAARLDRLHRKMEAQPGDERAVAAWSRAHDLFEHAGGYAAESEARSVLAGLGLTADRTDRPISVLSGGERRRVELARILYAGTDLLLLDEPTNHLDNDAREWVLGFLRSYRGALIVVSHDLELLDESITRVCTSTGPARPTSAS
jgi:ATPase subunit of ABC transporter with duplicated ATPase domains